MNNEYQAQYQKENLRQIRLKINRKTEPELLAWVEKQGNIQGYIKQLILEDMKREPKHAEMGINNYICPRCRNPIEMFYAGEQNSYCAFCGQRVEF